MSSIIKKVNDKYFEIPLAELYRARVDNDLTTEELLSKYSNLIFRGDLKNVRELEEWEVKVQEMADVLEAINVSINDINEKLKQL